MPVTYPGGGPRMTVEALLNQPRLIARSLTDITRKRFVADRIFARGTPEQVVSGAAIFQRSESIYTDRDAEEVGVRAEYPRASWSEDIFSAAVHKYGLEVPISDEARRRNALDQIQRGTIKMSNALVKFVDALAMAVINNTANGITTVAASGDWSTAATDIIADIATARAYIANLDEGYEADTMIVNPAQELDLILDTDIRAALPREGGAPMPSVITGRPVPLLGLRQIIATNQQTAGVVTILQAQVAGTIADEAPISEEGYTTFNPSGQQAPVFVKRYRNDNVDETILRAARFPAMWLAEPTSVRKLTGA